MNMLDLKANMKRKDHFVFVPGLKFQPILIYLPAIVGCVYTSPCLRVWMMFYFL